jgi:hypothetical protein
MVNYLLITNDKFIKPGNYTLELDVMKGKKEIHCILQGVRVVRENTLKVRKPMSAEARKNISKGRKAYFKRVNGNGKKPQS